MSHTLNSVDRLGAPFCEVDEQVFVIPEGGYNEVANKFFKLVFLLDGACWHQVDGGPRVRLEAGDVLVLPRICLQRYWPLSPGGSHRVHALRLIFDSAWVPPLSDASVAPAGVTTFVNPESGTALAAGDVGCVSPTLRRLAPCRSLSAEPIETPAEEAETDLASFARRRFSTPHHLPLAKDLAVQSLLADLRKEAEEQPPGFRFRITALCASLVVLVARQLTQVAEREMTEHRRRRVRLVEQAREYLVKNLDRKLSLCKVAQHVRVSEEHLARVFRQETGQTVFDFLQHIRLEKAKTYLLGSELNITEISRQTGYSSVSLFSRRFKLAVGVSPLAYRQERWTRAVPNHSVLKQSAPSRSESVLNGRGLAANEKRGQD